MEVLVGGQPDDRTLERDHIGAGVGLIRLAAGTEDTADLVAGALAAADAVVAAPAST